MAPPPFPNGFQLPSIFSHSTAQPQPMHSGAPTRLVPSLWSQQPSSSSYPPLDTASGAVASATRPSSNSSSSAFTPPSGAASASGGNASPGAAGVGSADLGAGDGKRTAGLKTNGTSQAGQGAGKRSKGVVGGGEDPDDPKERERKRSRQALSCSECKRRKIKCDRRTPCEACLKRGTPEGCTWEDVKISPSPQPFALVQDLELLAKRLQDVERFLQTLPEGLRQGAPKPVEFRASAQPPPVTAASASLEKWKEGSARAESVAADDEALAARDMEDAAIALEGAAFSNNGHPSTYRIPPFRAPSPALDTSQPRSKPKELTRTLTCIMDEGITVTDDARAPLAAAQMGLDIDCSAAELPRLRREAIARAAAVLPQSKEESWRGVRKYLDEVNWMSSILHPEALEAEVEFYWHLKEQGRDEEVCPIWLAMYAQVLSLALDLAQPLAAPSPQSPRFDLAKALKLQAASQRLLTLGEWRGRPQFRSVLVILLLDQFQQSGSGDGHATSRFLSNLACAIRVLQLMGHHKLGPDDETMPPEDPAFPPGKNSLKRQWALRVWGKVLFLDSICAAGPLRAYMIMPERATTSPVSNVDFCDLSTTEWKLNPRPRSVFTDSSLEYFKHLAAVHARKAFDLLRSPDFTYNTVLKLDAEFHEFIASIPAEDPILEAKRPQLRWKRLLTTESVHSRICRMHRPFLTRGYTPGSQFAPSREKCISSAIFVLEHQGAILDISPNMWFIYSHTLAAAIVLFADLFHAIDNETSAEDIERKKEILLKAHETFARYPQIRMPLRPTVQRGSRILSGLFMAEEKRRATRAALTLVGSASSTSVESFAQVLQRISREIITDPIHQPVNVSAPLSLQQPVPVVSATADALNDQFWLDLGLPAGVSDSTMGLDMSWGAVEPTQLDFWGLESAMPDFQFFGSGGNPSLMDQMASGW